MSFFIFELTDIEDKFYHFYKINAIKHKILLKKKLENRFHLRLNLVLHSYRIPYVIYILPLILCRNEVNISKKIKPNQKHKMIAKLCKAKIRNTK